MTYWISGCLLYVTVVAVLYRDKEVWPSASYEAYRKQQGTAMEVDTQPAPAGPFTGGTAGGGSRRTRRV